jgi:hypothetical protein
LIPIVPPRRGVKMESPCDICDRSRAPGSVYCSHHLKAYRNLVEAHKVWHEALGIGWVGFLHEVSAQSETGIWAIEVAESLLDANRSG